MKNSIVEELMKYAISQPDQLCMIDDVKEMTYSAVWKEVCTTASYLKSQGVVSGDCVVVWCTQDTRFVIWGLAIQLVGGIFVPMEKGAGPESIRMLMEETGSKFYFYKESLGGDAVCLEYPKEIQESEEIDFELPKGEQVAEILFSTGTTGKSKGIVLTHNSIIAVAENVINGVGMKKGNVELIPMPLSHSHGLRRYYANMLNGSTVVFMEGVTFVKKVFANLDKYHVTAIDLAPSALEILLKLSKNELQKYQEQLDYIQLGSAPLKEGSKEKLCTLLPNTRLYNFYGSTEAGCSCILDFNKENKPGCIGKPTVNSRFVVLDEERNEIRSDKEHTGFLACKGSMNMKEYYRQPQLTASVMKDGYVCSNDLGYIDEEGYVYMLGREDDVINYAGIKISPEEIEEVVLKCTLVKDCACVPVEESISGQVPKLFVVTTNGSDQDIESIQEWLVNNLDRNKLPKYVSHIDEIPRTYNGKILRKKLREM